MFELPSFDGHETVKWVFDPETGLRAIIAVHSTVRGPGLGGCRVWNYAHSSEALVDALRLSQGMSMKSAMADLPFGGGKAVILGPIPEARRAAQFQAFGRAVAALDGHYVTAEDVGAAVADMEHVSRQTDFVTGLPSQAGAVGGNPAPFTARGVLRGIEVVALRVLDRSDLDGVRVAVQGTGSVGGLLSEMLAERGAKLILADIDMARSADLARRLDAQVAETDEVLTADVDILAPCALGAVITEDLVPEIRAKAIAGAANNQLATPMVGARLAESGITFAPDYVINAGGLVAVAAEYTGVEDLDTVLADVDAIGPRLDTLLAQATEDGTAPDRLADRLAREKILAERARI
ncbi:MAG: Glu/Leu/Phe/Val dehydrogenase dimerization domain-containing protein [Pseudomonadota bacterium]